MYYEKWKDKFGDLLFIESEHTSPTGKLDIAIADNNGIILTYDHKSVIAIEIKTGKTFDSKYLFQFERYLLESNSLIIARVHTGDVFSIESSSIRDTVLIRIAAS